MKDETGVYVTPAFPKLVYTLDENNVYPGSKYFDLTVMSAKCTAKRMVPDYVSAKIMREEHQGNVFPPMGCRSFLSDWLDENGNFKYYGRFNGGVVTLNLPRIALDANGDMNMMWKLLDERCAIAREALECRIKRLETATSDVSPIHWQHGALARLKPGESIAPLLKNGYATFSLGYIGVFELVQIMLGKSHTTPEGRELGLKVVNYLNNKTKRWKEETGYGYSLYGTPSESTAGKMAETDAKKYGDIKNVTDKGFYINSYHVDVRERINAQDKLSFEADFQKQSPGGTISYVEIPDMNKNIDGILEIMQHIYQNIQYAELNTKSDYCKTCGFEGEMKTNEKLLWVCPECGETTQDRLYVVRRSCGYIGSEKWSAGRTKDIINRVEHTAVTVDNGILDDDTVNGEGLRVSVWFTGCPFKCKGCHNEHLWEHNPEFKLDMDKIISLVKERKKLSILGGEPLAKYNLDECLELVTKVRKEVPEASIYLWTGYNEDELYSHIDSNEKISGIIKNLNKIIVGRYIEELKINNPMYGSSNQKVIELR